MARPAIKSRKAAVALEGDNAEPLGTRKPIGVMAEGGQDAEAGEGKAAPSKGRKKRTSPGIVTHGKGR